MSRPKPTVGMRLFAEIHAGRKTPMDRKWGVVTKVGRKFFDVEFGRITQTFNLSDWKRSGQNVQANFPTHLYLNEQECDDRILRDTIAGNLSAQLRHPMDWRKLTLEQVKQIHDIVNP